LAIRLFGFTLHRFFCKKVKASYEKKKGMTMGMNIDKLKLLQKSAISESAKLLSENDIDFLIRKLMEKEYTIRYNTFLLLQAHSKESALVYRHWNELADKLESDNSFQRSIGVMLLADNVRWDSDGKFNSTINRYLNCCSDEKFIVARQAIQGLSKILNASNTYDKKIKQHLANLPLKKYKKKQQKLLAKDIAQTFKILENR